jgi:hypothetical protein
MLRAIADATLIATALVLVIALALLLPGLGRAPFDDPGEGMHAEIAREILLTNDWITLYLNGVRYFDKPPLLYWLTALSIAVFGPTEWAARLWPLLAALAAVAGTTFLGVKLLSPCAGLVAGLALLTSAGFFAYARYVRPETLFVASIQWGFALLLLALVESRRWFAVLGCALLGIAALAKDPLGALGPLAALAIALALAGRIQPFSAWLPWRGIALLILLGGAWYLVSTLKNPGFLWYTVVDNHLLNVVRARSFPDEDVPLTSGEFLAVAGLGAFPWILTAGLTTARLIVRRAWREPNEMPWIALSVWVAGVFLLFTFAPFKLPHYGLLVYPALALLAARWWEESRAAVWGQILHLIAFLVIALCLAWVYWSDGRAFSSWVFNATDVYTRKELSISQSSPFPPWENLRPLVGATALIFGVGSLGLFVAIGRGARTLGLVTVCLTLLAWMPLVGSAGSLVAETRSVRALAREIMNRVGPGDVLVHEGPIENSGALEFYSGARPRILDGTVSVLGFGATFPDSTGTFWDRARLAEAWRGPRRVFLITIRTPERSVVSDLTGLHKLAEGGGRWLYSNRP